MPRTPASKGKALAPEPTAEGRETTPENADAVDAANEDVPMRPAPRKNLPHIDEDACHCYESSFPKGKLPPPPDLLRRELEESERPKPKHGKDGVDKAMEILDDYYEGVPLRNPNVDHGGE
jgi:hypothetical protein